MVRLFDLMCVSIALLILLPIFVLVPLVLSFTGERKVFYFQTRIGLGGKVFNLIKFATMLENSPNIGPGDITVKDDPRVLKVGKFLRKTKINELPQLINVLMGNMSLIGPRPLTPRIFEKYDAVTKEKLYMLRPGLSGIGSIVFRDEERILHNVENVREVYDVEIVPFKAELETWFFENRSFTIHIALVFLTVYAVVFKKNKVIYRLIPTLPKPKTRLQKMLIK